MPKPENTNRFSRPPFILIPPSPIYFFSISPALSAIFCGNEPCDSAIARSSAISTAVTSTDTSFRTPPLTSTSSSVPNKKVLKNFSSCHPASICGNPGMSTLPLTIVFVKIKRGISNSYTISPESRTPAEFSNLPAKKLPFRSVTVRGLTLSV